MDEKEDDLYNCIAAARYSLAEMTRGVAHSTKALAAMYQNWETFNDSWLTLHAANRGKLPSLGEGDQGSVLTSALALMSATVAIEKICASFDKDPTNLYRGKEEALASLRDALPLVDAAIQDARATNKNIFLFSETREKRLVAFKDAAEQLLSHF